MSQNSSSEGDSENEQKQQQQRRQEEEGDVDTHLANLQQCISVLEKEVSTLTDQYQLAKEIDAANNTSPSSGSKLLLDKLDQSSRKLWVLREHHSALLKAMQPTALELLARPKSFAKLSPGKLRAIERQQSEAATTTFDKKVKSLQLLGEFKKLFP
mmetsp:Transcript_17666/g.34510  ORF Transcript_17666/g.34510 Transcript_17666/m.34510 type:complete len:156 (-) Transcript_17666:90-557(-)